MAGVFSRPDDPEVCQESDPREHAKLNPFGVMVAGDWARCEHLWREMIDNYSGPGRTDMCCVKCGVPGERTDATGEVYWPAT